MISVYGILNTRTEIISPNSQMKTNGWGIHSLIRCGILYYPVCRDFTALQAATSQPRLLNTDSVDLATEPKQQQEELDIYIRLERGQQHHIQLDSPIMFPFESENLFIHSLVH